ncbi:tissue factor pathway inhibitor a isoform X2 [Echeneis naucrates]|uniref:Tissue factor pathway inhibitor n=1 Tax=Echeneis naucrates TaxID=173247 RepID=A0A665VKP7_ECHNA|nr:tissue factor pathway inhibitor-like isoform X2 [Echeneis naucrates]
MILPSYRWLLCAFSLSCVALLGTCRRHGQAHGAQPELLIFNELCALKDEPGPCKAIKDRFFFNVDTGSCELFEYGGCGGNANNFETLEACEEMCFVSEDKNPCHLPEAPGPCRGLVTRYFFDNRSKQCKQFFYGGCFGNANNFRSLSECQAKCHNPAKPTRTPEVYTQPAKKLVAVQPTLQTADVIVRDPQVQVNNQEVKEFKPKEVCFSRVDRGTCDGTEKRFAYNPVTKRCHVFHYTGCGGNENNFTSRRLCIKKCIRSGNVKRMKMVRIRRKNLDHITNRSVGRPSA